MGTPEMVILAGCARRAECVIARPPQPALVGVSSAFPPCLKVFPLSDGFGSNRALYVGQLWLDFGGRRLRGQSQTRAACLHQFASVNATAGVSSRLDQPNAHSLRSLPALDHIDGHTLAFCHFA
jgi:hypothetical protein